MKPAADTPTKSKKVSFMAEEVSVSKFEYNDDDIDDVVNEEDEEEHDNNDNNLSQENLEKPVEDPNVSNLYLNSHFMWWFYLLKTLKAILMYLISGIY